MPCVQTLHSLFMVMGLSTRRLHDVLSKSMLIMCCYPVWYLNHIMYYLYAMPIYTFRDLWTAMIIAILAIYFLMVWQFRSFAIAWVVMLPFLLGFFGIFPGFSILYLFKNEYLMQLQWIISLAWIVVWNAILLIDYINILKSRWWTIERAIIEAGYIRFMPIMLTSMAAIFGAIKNYIWSSLVWTCLECSLVTCYKCNINSNCNTDFLLW